MQKKTKRGEQERESDGELQLELLSSLFSLKAYDSHAACSTAVCSVPPDDTALTTVRDQLFLVTLLPNLTRGR